MNKYTKGKWKVKYEGEVGQAISRIYIAGKDGFAIARIADKEEREANAHLIAAAPDMYEALQRIIARRMENHETEAAYIPPEIEAVYKALAEAEGK